jgi:hypothetical protein
MLVRAWKREDGEGKKMFSFYYLKIVQNEQSTKIYI